MAVSLLSREVSDLCIGKPALRWLPLSATVADALSALRRSGKNWISIWNCDHYAGRNGDGVSVGDCRCVGKVCLVDVVCFLCREDNLVRPLIALESPVSVLIRKVPELVKHLEPNSSLREAIDCILEGAQNLIVPKRSRMKSNPKQNLLIHGHEFCWITQEDVIRFFLNSINLFSPTPAYSIESLNIIDDNILAVHYDDPALSALPLISNAITSQTAVAVVDEEGNLIGEISPRTLSCCDEKVASAIVTLSAGDLVAYVDCCGSPEDLVQLVKARLEERNLVGMLELMEVEYSASSMSSSSSSSDDELSVGRNGKHRGNSGLMATVTEPIVCYPESSLVAVMIQAVAHRVSYVWVIERDCSIVGIVTFAGMLKVFRDQVAIYA
ncbi:hypothetical protein Nepgr_032188 [Nepenthes gracilis]|uniref:CBS domain-containing protein n=1 Tax=Nepenthes gracilis TaxID=150966 RepID=A0AAD3Y7H2_NEPGR|nr:hypothetical protein Nepgr_032188 [Nepenthes gracilis]